MALLFIVLVIAAMLLGNALFVAAEFAAVSASKPKLKSQADDERPEAGYIHDTTTDEYRMDRYIAGAQVGITVTSLVIGFYGQRALLPYLTPAFEAWLPSGVAVAAVGAPLVLILLTVLQVIFGELFPKSIAVRAPERTARATARPMRWSLLLLGPFITLLNGSAFVVMRWLGLDKPKEAGDEHSHDELRQLINDSLKGGAIEKSSHEMLRQVLAFQERTVWEVMEPRRRVKSLDPGATAGPALARMLKTPFTRFPVIDGTDTQQPSGFVHIRDLHELAEDRPDAPVQEILRPLEVFPDSLTLSEAWTRLHEAEAAFALVFNEYGVVSGLVSVEDLVEEIVGEVVDEFDQEEPLVSRRGDRVTLRGDLKVDEINHRFGLDLPEEDAATLSGLAALHLGVEDARRGAEIAIGQTAFRIESVENGLPRLLSFAPPGGPPEDVPKAGGKDGGKDGDGARADAA